MDLVIDIGGTNSRMATVMATGTLGEPVMWNTPKVFDEAMETLRSKIRELSGGSPLNAAVAGVAGAIDKNKKKVVRAPNLIDWENKPLTEELSKMTGTQVALENDAAIEALGEANRGAGRRYSIVAYITVGTGIGGAKVVDGKLDANAMGFEPGQQIISVGDKVGYWEEFASGAALERMHGKKPWDISEAGPWESEARLVAIGLHNLTVMWSPEIIILGGGVSKSLDLEKVKMFMQEMKFFAKIPEVCLGELGEKSGLYGAMALLHTPGG